MAPVLGGRIGSVAGIALAASSSTMFQRAVALEQPHPIRAEPYTPVVFGYAVHWATAPSIVFGCLVQNSTVQQAELLAGNARQQLLDALSVADTGTTGGN